MSLTPDALRADLAGLAQQEARSEAAADNIHAGAEQRHREVLGRLEELRGEALTDPDAAKEYEALLAERGQLNTVLGRP